MPRILLTCPRGLSGYLCAEVEAMGYKVVSEEAAGVWTEGDMADAMRMNLWLRSAHRVLLLLEEFIATDPDALYRHLYAMPWEDHIPCKGYLSVESHAETGAIRDTRFLNLKVKDAVVDRIRDRRGARPDSGSAPRGAVVNVYWKDDRCLVYLDTSGETLSKRGYRKVTHKAPMQETLSAAVVLATGWLGAGAFINPMCGSGTLAIEAALIALGRAPGATRLNFGFMHLEGFDKERWKELRADARRSAKKSVEGRIIATDSDPRAVEAARKNAATAGVGHLIEFSVCDFRDTEVPEGGGVVVLNPEYGKRMGAEKGLERIYGAIGDFFKQKCKGYMGYVFTGNPALSKQIGLRTRSRRIFHSGPIECRLLEYELYEGSRKGA
jgi:putative N6-adenine-specific DNA methylase